MTLNTDINIVDLCTCIDVVGLCPSILYTTYRLYMYMYPYSVTVNLFCILIMLYIFYMTTMNEYDDIVILTSIMFIVLVLVCYMYFN